MSVINRGSITKQLRPGLNAVFGTEYNSIENEHLPMFDVEKSIKNFEEEVLMTGFETAPVKAEGAAVEFDEASETYVARYTHETIALAFALTEEALEDNLYDTFAKMRAKALARAMANTKQIKAANVFNLGFSATGGDGAALFSASHPTKTGGNQSNTASSDLSETTLESALITIATMKDDRGVLIGAKAQSLIIPPQLMFTAQKILGADLSTTIKGPQASPAAGDGVTSVNDPNIIKRGGYFPKGWHVNHRLTDTNAWFIRTDVPNGAKMFIRKPLETSMEADWGTGNIRYKARERYSFGYSDWRGYFGSSGST
jgi:hypothetical protein